ncbi:hypothetical protein BpHYR1_028653 [Brachionus plicatilis]|uniref:Uncharacterized protein n=1 Tax=Brachionus plicatilis TaxID=10195 RepID=A0A3M7RWH7_BRAPC|nr:hypothetical protein BpHYR1_028653 [Brachionus plicatilis]
MNTDLSGKYKKKVSISADIIYKIIFIKPTILERFNAKFRHKMFFVQILFSKGYGGVFNFKFKIGKEIFHSVNLIQFIHNFLLPDSSHFNFVTVKKRQNLMSVWFQSLQTLNNNILKYKKINCAQLAKCPWLREDIFFCSIYT